MLWNKFPHISRMKKCLIGFVFFASWQLHLTNASELKLRQSKLKGLLVQPLSNGNFAGKASQMNATATPLDKRDNPINIRFNQRVGKAMDSALKEVTKYLRVKHDTWPSGYDIEIAFEDRFTAKDGPSAAICCALLLDSLVTGQRIDPFFAVTGDMNADGSVQPVGGVPAKVRGAFSKSCKYVAIPAKNARSLSDLVLLNGINTVSRIQVFTIDDFDEAAKIAFTDKDQDIKTSIEEFHKIQSAIFRHKTGVLRNAKVQKKLREILELAPNHLSAKLALQVATGRAPKTLSLHGSLEKTENSASTLLQAARSSSDPSDALATDDLAKAISELKRIRLKLDKRVWSYADSIQDFGKLVREFKTSPPRGNSSKRKKLTEIQIAAEKIEKEVMKIRNSKEIMEELIQD